jgi:hypothetical protein
MSKKYILTLTMFGVLGISNIVATENNSLIKSSETIIEFEDYPQNLTKIEDPKALNKTAVSYNLSPRQSDFGKGLKIKLPQLNAGKYRFKIRCRLTQPQSQAVYNSLCMIDFGPKVKVLDHLKPHPGYGRPILPLIGIVDNDYQNIEFNSQFLESGKYNLFLHLMNNYEKSTKIKDKNNLIIFDRLTIYPIDSLVSVENINVKNVFYKPGENVDTEATIHNLEAKDVSGIFRGILEWDLDKKKIVFEKNISLKPNERKTIAFKFQLNKKDKWGCNLEGSFLIDNKKCSSEKTLFPVANTPVKVAVFDIWPSSRNGYPKSKNGNLDLVNIVEVFCPWPNDWGTLCPQKDWWYQGQSGGIVKKENIKAIIRDCHSRGRSALFYSRGDSYGKSGFDLIRLHPEYARDAGGGIFYDQYDSWGVANWEKIGKKFNRVRPNKNLMYHINPDLSDPKAFKHMVSQWEKTTEEYQWDGFRYDGYLWVNRSRKGRDIDDAASAKMFRTAKKEIQQKYPNFIFGNNSGLTRKMAVINDDVGIAALIGQSGSYGEMLKSYCENNGLILNEGVNDISSWQAFSDDVVFQNDFIHQAGGQMVVHMDGLGKRFKNYLGVDRHYARIINFASGGHVSGNGISARAPYLPFTLRYSAYLWDTECKREDVTQWLKVKSPEKLWYKRFFKIKEKSDGKILILNLINPPLKEKPAGRDAKNLKDINYQQLPRAIKNIELQLNIPSNLKVDKIWCLSPESNEYTQKLLGDNKTKNNETVKIPDLKTWNIIVISLKNKQGD